MEEEYHLSLPSKNDLSNKNVAFISQSCEKATNTFLKRIVLEENNCEEMTKNVMNAIQYEKYGGGSAGLKVCCFLILLVDIKSSTQHTSSLPTRLQHNILLSRRVYQLVFNATHFSHVESTNSSSTQHTSLTSSLPTRRA